MVAEEWAGARVGHTTPALRYPAMPNSTARGLIPFGQSRGQLCADQGLLRELNPGPLAPEARIMPLDQAANVTHVMHETHKTSHAEGPRLKSQRVHLPTEQTGNTKRIAHWLTRAGTHARIDVPKCNSKLAGISRESSLGHIDGNNVFYH